MISILQKEIKPHPASNTPVKQNINNTTVILVRLDISSIGVVKHLW